MCISKYYTICRHTAASNKKYQFVRAHMFSHIIIHFVLFIY